jgi:protein phosphatase 1L
MTLSQSNIINTFNLQPAHFKNDVYGEVWKLGGSLRSNDLEWGRHHAFEDRDRLQKAVANVVHRMWDQLQEAAKNQVAGRLWMLAGRPQNVEWEWGRHHAKDIDRVCDLLTAINEIQRPLDLSTYRLERETQNKTSNIQVIQTAQSSDSEGSCFEIFCRWISLLFSWFFPKNSPSTIDPIAREHRLHKTESQIQKNLQEEMRRCQDQMNSSSQTGFHYLEAPFYWETEARGNLWDIGNPDVRPGRQAVHPHRTQVGGLDVGYAHAQGRRGTMEDEHIAVAFNLNIQGKNYPVRLFGVFDGHGGKEASQYMRDHLQAKLQATLTRMNMHGLSDKGIWDALKMTFVELNDDLMKTTSIEAGTTATVAMILDGNLWTANVGDSRTVLDNQGEAEQLSHDAKPDDERYKRGIEHRGGFVRNKRVNGNLAVARAIGDRRLNGSVSARPKITKKPMSTIKPNSHLILCCDGVYDVATTKQIVKGVHDRRGFSPERIAKDIIYSAYESGSTDNLSAVVVKL